MSGVGAKSESAAHESGFDSIRRGKSLAVHADRSPYRHANADLGGTVSVLFRVRYMGAEGMGVAAICIGGGKIVGFDGADGRYQGRYIEQDGRIRGTAKLMLPPGWPLVTGGTSDSGMPAELTFDWPAAAIESGEPLELFVNGLPVQATVTKIGQIA